MQPNVTYTNGTFVPRFVPEAQAAKTLGFPLDVFRHYVQTKRLSGPLPECNLFDLKRLNEECDRLSGIGSAGNALDAWLEKNG